MIENKIQYKMYLEKDALALKEKKKRPRIIGDKVWKFERFLRKTEYINNCKKGKIWTFIGKVYRYRLQEKGRKLGGYCIPINVFEEGLALVHYGSIVVNGTSKVGKNCRILEGVTIGATNGKSESAIIGNNVFIGTGAKIIGNAKIANDVAIGANSVVTKDILENGITVAGVPAKKISNNNSHSNLSKELLK